MTITNEEIQEIANQVANKVIAHSGLVCNCKSIEPIFLQGIEDIINRATRPGESEERGELLGELNEIAKQCGYEKIKDVKGEGWVKFPKQEAILRRFPAHYIIKEHGDGDLTLDISMPEHGRTTAILTTEGELFVTTPESIRIEEGG